MKCCKYTSGMLRERVEIQRKTRTSDGKGGFTETWAAIEGAPEWAMVRALSGSERYASSRVEATSTHRIVVRYFAGLLESDRIAHRGRIHNVRFLNNVDYEDQWLEITTNLGVAV